MKNGWAVLVDGDQLPPDTLPGLIERLAKEAPVTERICVRNWRSTRDQQEWRAFADSHGFRLLQRDPVAVGKNASDIELAVIAIDLLHEGRSRFCLVSGDTDFTPVVNRLRRGGCTVEWVTPEELGVRGSGRGRRGDPAKQPARGRGRRPAAKPADAAGRSPQAGGRASQARGTGDGKGQAQKTPASKQAPAKKPAAKPSRRGGKPKATAADAGPTPEQKRFAKPVRRAIDQMKKAGQHERGWVSVNRLGSMLAQSGHKRDDYGFAKSRPMRQVLEDLGFEIMQIETGAYRVRI